MEPAKLLIEAAAVTYGDDKDVALEQMAAAETAFTVAAIGVTAMPVRSRDTATGSAVEALKKVLQGLF